jgi:hypothetical protein
MCLMFAATYPARTSALMLYGTFARMLRAPDYPMGLKDLVAGSGIKFEDRGVHALKGVPGEWRLYAVASEYPARSARTIHRCCGMSSNFRFQWSAPRAARCRH